jgi:hypothetical protein
VLLYLFKTSDKATAKLDAADAIDDSVREVLDGLKWRLNKNPTLGAYSVDNEKNIYLMKSPKFYSQFPIVMILYQVDYANREILIRDLLVMNDE